MKPMLCIIDLLGLRPIKSVALYKVVYPSLKRKIRKIGIRCTVECNYVSKQILLKLEVTTTIFIDLMAPIVMTCYLKFLN